MARINQALLARIQNQLGLSSRRVYSLIEDKVRETHLPRPLAAIALASEHGINISRFVSSEDLSIIRQTAVSAMPRSVVTPPEAVPGGVKGHARAHRRRQGTLPRRRGTSVFVVHGRNETARNSMF